VLDFASTSRLGQPLWVHCSMTWRRWNWWLTYLQCALHQNSWNVKTNPWAPKRSGITSLYVHVVHHFIVVQIRAELGVVEWGVNRVRIEIYAGLNGDHVVLAQILRIQLWAQHWRNNDAGTYAAVARVVHIDADKVTKTVRHEHAHHTVRNHVRHLAAHKISLVHEWPH